MSTLLLPHDLIAVTPLKTDDDLDRTFEVTWATTDYLLMPSNADPTGGHDESRPSNKVWADIDSGTNSELITGVQEVLNEELDTSETAVDVDTRIDIEAGHTILIDSEQMFVESYSTTTLTVRRGVNGTTTPRIARVPSLTSVSIRGP